MNRLNFKFNVHSIATQMMLLLTIIILFAVSVVGVTGYYIARDQLIKAGKREMYHITNSAFATLEAMNNQVENGTLTLEEAKQEARILLSGPLLDDGKHDYKKSHFLYKGEGYVLGYDARFSSQVHPSNPIGSIPEDTTNREKMVNGAKGNTVEERYVYFEDKNEETGAIRSKISYLEHFQPWGWYIGLTVYEDEFYDGLAIVKTMIFICTSMIILISVTLFYLAIRKKILLLKEVTNSSKSFAEGNIKITKLRESRDEVGQLAKAYNMMSQQLSDFVKQVKHTTEHLLDSATNLSALSDQTLASSEEIGNSISEIAIGTQGQATDLESINHSVERLTQSICSMNDQSKIIKTVTTKSQLLSQEGTDIVASLRRSNTDSLSASEQISMGVKSLYDKTQEIYHITGTIQNISAQTNLLALNASIEAARAGEHGRGFAVVADEIRKLAEQSKAATHQVQNVVSSITAEIEKTVETVSQTMGTINKLNEDVLDTEDKFNQLSQSIREIVSALDVLNGEVHEIGNQNLKISDGIQSSSGVSEQTAASVQEISSFIDVQIKGIANVAKSAEQLNDLNKKLNGMLERYQF